MPFSATSAFRRALNASASIFDAGRGRVFDNIHSARDHPEVTVAAADFMAVFRRSLEGVRSEQALNPLAHGLLAPLRGSRIFDEILVPLEKQCDELAVLPQVLHDRLGGFHVFHRGACGRCPEAGRVVPGRVAGVRTESPGVLAVVVNRPPDSRRSGLISFRREKFGIHQITDETRSRPDPGAPISAGDTCLDPPPRLLLL
ncbi:MAG: hypothetical protein MZV64_02725 [Ignavibacteriales bacterium]|nr:hypothetical protein [Ignavibacteriales bacterium]